MIACHSFKFWLCCGFGSAQQYLRFADCLSCRAFGTFSLCSPARLGAGSGVIGMLNLRLHEARTTDNGQLSTTDGQVCCCFELLVYNLLL